MNHPESLWSGLPVTAWLVLGVCALLVGFSKTALGGVAMLAVAFAAQAMPAKSSTGLMLVLLLVGDLVAIWIYRRGADWRLILRLIPPVLVGLGLGALFLNAVDGATLKRTMGVILLALLVIGLWPDRLGAQRRWVGTVYGGLAGFTTMVANGGGPPMSLYLLAMRFDKLRFLGTTAWFFFAVNLTKLPISVGLGIIGADTLVLAAPLAPIVLLGTWLGRVLVERIDQLTFNRLVTAVVAAAALSLILV